MKDIIKKLLRAKVRDVAFQYRMGAGFAGDVNRVHPVTIEPALIDASAPPTAYGQAVVVDATTQGVRPLVSSDSGLTFVYGITVRPFPLQAPAGSTDAQQNLGAAIPPISGVIDVLRSGYIMVQTNAGITAPVKGGAVFIWVAATSGAHIQGQFESASGGGSTVALDVNHYQYNGGPDANGVAEIAFNV